MARQVKKHYRVAKKDVKNNAENFISTVDYEKRLFFFFAFVLLFFVKGLIIGFLFAKKY